MSSMREKERDAVSLRKIWGSGKFRQSHEKIPYEDLRTGIRSEAFARAPNKCLVDIIT